jgi:hypothetical protein
MKALITQTGQLGPFASITRTEDDTGWLAGDCIYPDGVIGEATAGDWVEPARVYTTADRAALAKQIDSDTDVIYRAVQGDRGAEYALAETDAIAYTEAGYTGTVPASVASWAAAKGQTGAWAAQSILATATQWRGAQSAIRANRLLCKEQAKVVENLATVEAEWRDFVALIRTALGLS